MDGRPRSRPEIGSADEPPFRAKGLVFLGAREFYAESVRGGPDAVRAQLEPTIAAFFEQKFLSGGWYDVMPILPISAAAARVANRPVSQLIRKNAEWLANRDLRGIYRFIVSMASVEMVVERLPDLSLRYFGFGHADGKVTASNTFESNRYGIPAPLEEWFAHATAGFVPVALGCAGAKNVRVRALGHAPDGEAHGVKLVRSTYQISWE
jgi:hypothetical protein